MGNSSSGFSRFHSNSCVMSFHCFRRIFCVEWLSRCCGAFQQDGSSGNRRPQEQPFRPCSARPPGERRRNPQTEAIKTVQELAPESRTSQLAQVRHDLPRAVLGIQQVCEAPDRKCGKNALKLDSHGMRIGLRRLVCRRRPCPTLPPYRLASRQKPVSAGVRLCTPHELFTMLRSAATRWMS